MGQRPPRTLTEREFTAIRDRLLNEAPDGLDEANFNRWIGPRLEAAIGEAEHLPPTPEGSAARRLVGGAWEMLNPVEMVKGAYQALTSPIETAKGLASAQGEQFTKAADAFSRGEYSAAAGHTAAGMVPIVGPLAADIGEQAGEGDIAGAAGRFTGLMAPLGIAPAVRTARSAVPQRAAAALERGATDRVVDVMAPKVGPNKTRYGGMAEKVAPDVVTTMQAEGAAWSREGLHRQVSARLADAETALDAASDARLKARTFETRPVLEALHESRQALMAHPVEASKVKPRVTPPDPKAVQAAEKGAADVLHAERQYVLRWLADDLREMPYQPGGSTKRSRREAYDNARAGESTMVFNPSVAGTPTQEMFHAVGLKGTRAQIAARLEKVLEGKATDPKLEKLADAFREAWTGERFDFSRVSDEAMQALGARPRDLRSPITLPKDLESPVAARFHGPEMIKGVEPLSDPLTPRATKTGRPLGRSVVPGPNADRVAKIDQAIAELRRLGPVARYEDMRKIRQAYDREAKAIYSPAVTQDFLKVQGGQHGAADVTGALRTYLAEIDPQTATANGQYALWRKAHDVLEATAEVERTRPKVGRVIAARVGGAVFGGHAAGPAGAAAGLIAGPVIEALLSSAPTTKLQSARLMGQLAEAIRKGDVGRVQSLTHRLRRLVPAGAIATERATSPSALQTGPMPQASGTSQ